MKEIVLIAKTNCEARLMLLKSFEPLIKKCFKSYVQDYNFFEDVMQEGYITILRCIYLYDLNSNSEFPAYVKTAVINNIRHFSRKVKSDLSLDEVNDNGCALKDLLKSDINIEEYEIQEGEITALHSALKKLTPKQLEIIDAYYFKDLSLQSICLNRRCHYMTIARLKERAIKALRKELAPYIS